MPRTPKSGKARGTPYKTFFKRELKRVKSEFPELSHKEAFTQAARNWKDSPENPKNIADAEAAPAKPAASAADATPTKAPLADKSGAEKAEAATNGTPVISSMAAHAVPGTLAAK